MVKHIVLFQLKDELTAQEKMRYISSSSKA